jgi:hypothetical protein
MSQKKRPTGHLQVKTDKNGRGRSFWAFWRDRNDKKGGRRLGPAHIRDSGRRSARGAVIWRAGHGPKPSAEHLTPREAQACLETIIEELRAAAEVEHVAEHTLQQAVEGWLAERKGERGLKRSTIAGYEDMFERLFRDLGADTPLRSLADGRLRGYFADFKAYRVMSETTARHVLAEGKNVQQLTIERWTAQPAESQALEVATKDEALRLADELPGTWKASAARLLPRCPARRAAPATCLTHRGDGPASGRLGRQATEDEALDAGEPGRRADRQCPELEAWARDSWRGAIQMRGQQLGLARGVYTAQLLHCRRAVHVFR